MEDATQAAPAGDNAERESTLAQLEEWVEKPMQILGIIWLGLLIIEFTRGRSTLVVVLSTIIWIIFVVEFVLRMILAPDKSNYLKRNWLVAISLVVPVLRI